MKLFYGVLLSLLIAVPCFAAKKVEFKNYGFSIETMPVSEEGKDEVFQSVTMFLPSKGVGFSPNVNIQEQKINMTIDEYMEFSDSQFETLGFETQKKKTDKTLTYEYTADMEGISLHVYSKAFFAGEKVYLVTGMSLVSQWDEVGEVLKKNVDSFKILK